MSSAPYSTEDIVGRTEKLLKAYNDRDVEIALAMFVDNGLEYSDYGVIALNMDKPAFANFLNTIINAMPCIDLKTISISRNKEFTAWEWEFKSVKKEGEKTGFEDFLGQVPDLG